MELKELYKSLIKTEKGEFVVLSSAAGIYELFFPGSNPDRKYQSRDLPWPQLAIDLRQYLAGKPVNWKQYPLDCSGYKDFTAKLLKEVSLIPRGHKCSYRQIAERAGFPLAWRAAGQALAKNRHPIIVPCHRVIGSNGKMGGFSGPRGWKEMLLKLEGAI
jgi:methylated-DNA-[protein]-cysteine S-methyltransferase